MVKIIKKYINNFLLLFGYQISKHKSITERVIITAHYYGKPFKCFKDDPLSDTILLGKTWDPQLSEILTSLNNKHKNGDILEVGANIGASLLPHAINFPNFNFILVEPVSIFFSTLKENCSTFQSNNVQLHNIALSDNAGEVKIEVGLGTAGLTKLVHYQHEAKPEFIKSDTLDQFYFKNRTQERNLIFIKLDVDGYENKVLSGAKNTITKYRPHIFIELSQKLQNDLGYNVSDITNFFKQFNYSQFIAWDQNDVLLTKGNDLDILAQISSNPENYVNAFLIP